MLDMLETSNLLANADVSTRTAGVLKLFSAGKPLPADADDVLSAGANLLKNAIAGSSVLTGSGQAGDFAGDLSPLCWATDGYLLEHPAPAPQLDYTEVQRYLVSIADLLDRVASQINGAGASACSNQHVERAARFFGNLARVLNDEADSALVPPDQLASAPREDD